LKLSSDRNLAAEFGKKAKEEFIREFTLERYAEKLNKFFDEAYSASHKLKST
jgi:hypothetical protein